MTGEKRMLRLTDWESALWLLAEARWWAEWLNESRHGGVYVKWLPWEQQ